jgi:hypothetical protein
MGQSPSSEANGNSANQDIRRLLWNWNPKIQYPFHGFVTATPMSLNEMYKRQRFLLFNMAHISQTETHFSALCPVLFFARM